MPYVIDGNNVLHALRKAGLEADRQELVNLLEKLAAAGEPVTVVFDGLGPRGPRQKKIISETVDVLFGGQAPADELVMQVIKDNTAPRRLHVVSTDRQLRAAARRRRCPAIRSEDFVPLLLAAGERRPRRPGEPSEKFRGLTDDQSRRWLSEFGLEDE